MNVTIHTKSARSKKEWIRSLKMEEAMRRLQTDERKGQTVGKLREALPHLSPSSHWRDIDRLPLVCPGTSYQKKRNGTCAESYNGIILLEVNSLHDAAEAEEVKASVASWPTTLAALTGASGRSVKILVGGTLDDGTLPSSAEDIRRFHERLYKRCASVYEGVVQRPLLTKCATPEDTFRWSYDPTLFFNPAAQPVRLSRREVMTTASEGDTREYGAASVEPSPETNSFYRRRFSLALRQAMELLDAQPAPPKLAGVTAPPSDSDELERLLNAAALEALRMDIPQEEAVRQAWLNMRFHDMDRTLVRATVESVYAENSEQRAADRSHPLGEMTMQLQAFMEARYDLRFNELANSVEWRENNSASFVFQPLDNRVMNTMTQACHEAGLEVFDRDMKRYLSSTRIRNYNAARAYLRQIGDRWDGQTDYIGAMADRVPCSNKHWREWFHTWFLGMVAQWEGWNTVHANSVVPLLIGQQGCGKSTFGQVLLPPELRETGYRELVDFSSKLEAERLLTSALLINLDEFNQVSERVQQGFLKNLIQKASVKGRRPYSSATVTMRRYASFIATSNMNDVLSDPTGSRRFIVADIRDGQRIDLSGPFHYSQLYAQALAELDSGRRPYFTPEEVAEVEAQNARHAQLRPEVLRFLSVFELATERDARTRALKVSEMVGEVRRRTGFNFSDKAFNYLGHWLSTEARKEHVRKSMHNGCPVYLVHTIEGSNDDN